MDILKILNESNLQYRENQTGQIVVKVCPFCPDTKGKPDNLWKLSLNRENGLFLCHRCLARGNGHQFAERLRAPMPEPKFSFVDQYLYQDEDGKNHVRVTRLEDEVGNKRFHQERFESGGWVKGGQRKPLQPFLFSEWADENRVVIVEGEKCVLSLRRLGISATTFIGGCNGWRDTYQRYFQNREVVLLPDHDETGRKFVEAVARGLTNVISCKIVSLPGLQQKEDVFDWLANGGDAHTLKDLCENTPSINFSEQEDSLSKQWGAPRDLPSVHHVVQDITPEIIPEALRDWVTDIADRMQVPLICVTVLALTVVGSLIGRKARIYPKKEDDWYEVANLWSMIIMPSGRLKSPIINAVLKPLDELASQAEKNFSKQSKEFVFEHALLDAKIQAAKKEIQKIASSRAQNKDENLVNAQKSLMEMQENAAEQRDGSKRYKIHDATVEKIGELLKANTNGLLLVRDELSGWLSSLERTGREGDREFFLEAWNGKGSYDVDRIIRGSIHIPALCLSILGGIPPSKIESYVESAVSGGAGNDGLLQRFGLMVHADFKKDWRLVDRAPNKEAYARVQHVFSSIDQMDNDLSFRCNNEAQEIFYDWLTRLEINIRAEENECDAFISHISKYRKLVPALALQFFLLKKMDGSTAGEKIDSESLTSAIHWARHLENHARRVYSLALNPQIHSARSLAQKIKQGKITDGARLRDIYRHQWSNLKTRAAVDMAIAVLIECNWVQVQEVKPATGAPLEVLRLNPALQILSTQNEVDRTDTIFAQTSVSSVNLVSACGANL